MYRAVLFDIDGTLVDSNDAHASAWVDALAERARRVAHRDVRPLIGMGGEKLLPALAGIDPESDEGQAIADRRRQIFKERYFAQLYATRGAGDLIRFLSDMGVTLGVATSAQHDEVRDLLSIAGVDGLFDGAVSADDVQRSKPDPDVVKATLARIGCAPDQAVMVGDTPYDIEAARAAGVPCIVLRCGGWWGDPDFTGAFEILDDPRALHERLRKGYPALVPR
jgi:HAD superfamily hydrolase (TIGR01509 family)